MTQLVQTTRLLSRQLFGANILIYLLKSEIPVADAFFGMSLYKFVNYRCILIDKFFVFKTDKATFDKTRSGVIFCSIIISCKRFYGLVLARE